MVVNTAHDIRSGPALDAAAYADVRRRTIFECCKWDPQMQDVSVLAPFPILIEETTWSELARTAESLAAETLAAEAEIAARPDLLTRLGLPRAVGRAIRAISHAPRNIARVMRFDFHPTGDGWRISEVNSDVPGGYIEASGFTRLMGGHHPDTGLPPDPAAALADALRGQLQPGATVALVHATAYTDDRQVMTYLARLFTDRALRPVLVSPEQIHWTNDGARIVSGFHTGPVDAVFRFYPAEWLPNLPRRTDWRFFFAGSTVPLCNPAVSLVTQTKRFPLVWNDLRCSLLAWRQLLPETRDPRDVNWRNDSDWILKPALGRVGDAIAIAGVTPTSELRQIQRSARWFPRH